MVENNDPEAAEASQEAGVVDVAVEGLSQSNLDILEVLKEVLKDFNPQPGALGDLTRRVKEGFDPNAILNPGRMVERV